LSTNKVATGRYSSVSEVVREALRLLEERDQDRIRKIAEFNEEIGRRLESLYRGEHVTADEVRAHFKRKSAEHRKAAL
jgi:antitoxin ParD1/3/4